MTRTTEGLDLGVRCSLELWGYDLRGDVLEITARIAEEGGNADLSGPPLWDHPEWPGGWFRNNRPWTPPLHYALPYAPGGPWARNGSGLGGGFGVGLHQLSVLHRGRRCVVKDIEATKRGA